MAAPIPVEKAEELILYYIELKYLWLKGEVAKIHWNLERKAKELGMCLSSAKALIRYAKDVGMIPSKHKYYSGY